MLKQRLEQFMAKGLGAAGVSVAKVHLEHPSDLANGDYSTNIALTVAKERKENPSKLAEEIVQKLRELEPNFVSRIEAVSPGFINIYLADSYFAENLREIIAHGQAWGKTQLYAGQKAIVEYTDPNPFKEFHIGHIMSNTIGEALSRIVEWNGAEVKRACYQGDVGVHVAKAIYGLQQLGSEKPADTSSLSGKARYLGKAYAAGAQAYEGSAKADIDALNKKIYERTDAAVNALYDWGRKVSLDYFETIYAELGTKFDFYFFESETGKVGKNIVESNIGNVFASSDGAVVFHGEQHDKKLHTRVFLNKDGLPTYEAKELGLAKAKHDLYPYDLSVVVTANEVNDYFRVLLAAMTLLFPDLAAKTRHVSHGIMKLPTGKMSSRTGDVVTAEAMLDEVCADVLEKMAEREIADKERVANEVAVAAIKYAILKQSPGRDIVFDKTQSLSFEGDSGPYLQYAHTRALSVLEKGAAVGLKPLVVSAVEPAGEIERLLYRFPEIVERAGTEYAPQYLTTYLIELASAFNSYYAKNQIVDMENKERSVYRLALTKAVAITLGNGLSILGMAAPEHM